LNHFFVCGNEVVFPTGFDDEVVEELVQYLSYLFEVILWCFEPIFIILIVLSELVEERFFVEVCGEQVSVFELECGDFLLVDVETGHDWDSLFWE